MRGVTFDHRANIVPWGASVNLTIKSILLPSVGGHLTIRSAADDDTLDHIICRLRVELVPIVISSERFLQQVKDGIVPMNFPSPPCQINPGHKGYLFVNNDQLLVMRPENRTVHIGMGEREDVSVFLVLGARIPPKVLGSLVVAQAEASWILINQNINSNSGLRFSSEYRQYVKLNNVVRVTYASILSNRQNSSGTNDWSASLQGRFR